MSEIIGEIAILLGIGRNGKVLGKRKKMPGRVRRENDTVTISTEARRLLACVGDEAAAANEARRK